MPVQVSRILHAGYVFECDGQRIAFDPIFENPFSRNCYAFPEVQFDHQQIRQTRFSAVFISHFHDDHCSFESLDLLDRSTPLYVFCVFEELFDLLRELGFTEVHSLILNQAVVVGPFRVTPRRALDADVDSIFHIEAAGLHILNVVDSWIDDETLRLLRKTPQWDLVLWPFQTMREIEVIAPSQADPAPKELPPEWIEQLKSLNPRSVVPSSCQFQQESWSWYNNAFFPVTYAQFQKEIEAALPTTKVIRLNPSVSICLGEEGIRAAPSLTWIRPVGNQDVDYHYLPDLVPPSPSEIARHFAPLSSEQSALVWEYCRSGLLEKFRSLDPPLDSYFSKPRWWRLSVFDHEGKGTDFHYEMKRNEISLVRPSEGPLSWTTEISIAKMYAALELGESLTSLYLRVNDGDFDPQIAADLRGVDVIEDPLIRCLFHVEFGAYQKAQLKRLRRR